MVTLTFVEPAATLPGSSTAIDGARVNAGDAPDDDDDPVAPLDDEALVFFFFVPV